MIYNVRYTKGVLWLYSCGIAEDLAPPNNHTIKFLDECGYPGFGWLKGANRKFAGLYSSL